MTTRSFRQDAGRRPVKYRTPSPPTSAIESLSPISANEPADEYGGMRWPSHGNHYRSVSGTSVTFQSMENGNKSENPTNLGGAMDAFASIALATSSDTTPRRSSHHGQAGIRSGMVFAPSDDSVKRSAKRAKSEKLPSPQSRRLEVITGSRPVTSCAQLSESRVHEAELLLNFAQEARFSVPPQLPRAGEQPKSSELISPPNVRSGITSQQPDGTQQQDDKLAAPQESSEHTKKDGSGKTSSLGETYDEVEQKIYDRNLGGLSQPTSPHLQRASVQHKSLTSEQETSDTLGEQAEGMSAVASALEANLPSEPTVVAQQTEDGEHFLEESNNTVGQEGAVPQDLTPPGMILQPSDPSVVQKPVQATQNDISINVAQHQSSENIAVPHLNGDEPPSAPIADMEPKAIEPDRATDAGDAVVPAICAGCGFTRNIVNGEVDTSPTSWISCDACKSWYHFACAGFKHEREVRSVDKYRCRRCRPVHGATTYVRKSSRAHSSIDYAGLHQGVIKTSDDTPEHHYIQPIKEGKISFLPETFARMRPELVTAEYFEKCNGWREPIVVPAAWNPQPRNGSTTSQHARADLEKQSSSDVNKDNPQGTWTFDGSEPECAPDHGQDALDMVMPQGLTVRIVAELYGPEEKVEVIDVKSQNGEGKKWNMRRWADYYESKDNKIVRNVISLEVSQSRLGRLIRRPQIVRELDLQDSVWPADLQAKGEIPRVQFYCLMSVADCFTDFHIDFGGSSVFYHILKGKKTFFFIPPKEKHLKKYEEWCLSPAQNWTFLGDQTKECYRVDLSEGDTMLIPAGWIHAVWTPEDSLVIGGNFLTRLNYAMQLRIMNVEKATGVSRKFRYPHFQKIQWYTALRYLEEDHLPGTVKDLLESGGVFHRESPTYHSFNDWGENSRSGPENYHARYYSQAELEGLPELVRYLLRTAMIDLGTITDGITAETRNAVKRSIPRGHGEPLDVLKAFAAWCAWKRGNETIPSWAYPDAVPEPDYAGKMSVAAQKKLDREAALQAPRRQSARMQSLQQSSTSASAQVKRELNGPDATTTAADTVGIDPPDTPNKRRVSELTNGDSIETQTLSRSKRRRTMSGTGTSSHRKVACESCRKRRRACKHKDVLNVLQSNPPNGTVENDGASASLPLLDNAAVGGTVNTDASVETTSGGIRSGESEVLAKVDPNITMQQLIDIAPDMTALTDGDREKLNQEMDYLLKHPDEIASTPKMLNHLSGAGLLRLEHRIAGGPVNGLSVLSLNAPQGRGRTKACNDCRKSKRRCIHDEHGNEDPVKAREAAMPRPAAAHKRRKHDSDGNEIPSAKKLRRSTGSLAQDHFDDTSTRTDSDVQYPQQAPVANMVPSAPVNETQYQTQHHFPSALDQMQAAAAAFESNTSIGTDDQALEHAEIDLATDYPVASGAHSKTVLTESAPHTPFDMSLADPIVSIPPDRKEDIPLDPAIVAASNLTSSLVSPPASERQEADDVAPSPPATSSRHSSIQPPQQRYTPASESRRASSSSTNNESGRASSGPTTGGKEVSPITTISTAGEDDKREVGSGSPVEKRKSRGSVEAIADEESLRLIKELQAADLGLRRRGRA